MDLVRRNWMAIAVLAASLIITIVLPTDKKIQVIAPMVVGLLMLSLQSLLVYPNVVIEELSEEVAYHIDYNTVRLSLRAMIVNRSATGEGEIKNLSLTIHVSKTKDIDIWAISGQPPILGFRVKPHGILPYRMFMFESSQKVTVEDVAGKPASLKLEVVGQKTKAYNTRIKG